MICRGDWPIPNDVIFFRIGESDTSSITTMGEQHQIIRCAFKGLA
jgi:hypothetical protein